jgi:hypothetical protein
VRRISNNEFHVSLEEMNKSMLEIEEKMSKRNGVDAKWHSDNYILTISSNKEYILKRKFLNNIF